MKTLRRVKRPGKNVVRYRRSLFGELLENRQLLAADVFEPNDSFEAASDLGTGDQVHAGLSIHESNNDDWYKWTASANGNLTVDALFRNATGDLDLELYDSSRNLLTFSSSLDDNERLTWRVTADRMYFVRVYGFIGVTQPDYTLQIDGPQPASDAFEPNDSFATASILPAGDQTLPKLSIHQGGNDDWYQWRASADGVFTAIATFKQAQGNIDLELYDAGQNLLATAASTTDNEQVSRNVVAGQAYFIRAFGRGPAIARDYTLTINGPEPAADAFEPNDTFAQAAFLGAFDQTRSGLTIHEPGNDDWYRWTAPSDGTLNVGLLFTNALGNIDLELFNASQVLVGSSTGGGDSEQVTAAVVAGESYYIRVSGVAGSLQRDYTLQIDGPEPAPDRFEPNDSFAKAADLDSMDQTLIGLTIHATGNDDWYKWVPRTDGQLTVNVTFSQALGDIDIELYDAAQNVVASSASKTDNESFSLPVVGLEKYVIRVYGANGALQRDYGLAIDGPEIAPDMFEPNNTFNAATDLGSGRQNYPGLTIHAPGDDDWYRWTPTRNGILDVSALFISAKGDLDLDVFDANQQLIGQSTSFNDDEMVSINVVANQAYFIRVYAFGSVTQPNYELVIQGPEILPDKFEPNDSFQQPANLGAGDQTHRNLTIHESGNDDWYRWSPIQNGTLDVALLFTSADGNIDLELYDSSEQLIAESDSATDDEQASISVTAGQSYFMRVFGFAGSLQPKYTLQIDGPGPSQDSFEPNDSRSEASDLGTGNKVLKGLTIHVPGNEDWYQWRAGTDGTLVVDALFSNSLGNINLMVLDASGNSIASSSTTTDNEQVTLPVVGGATYFVRVFGVGNATQPKYDLLLNGPGPGVDRFEPNDGFLAAADLGSGDVLFADLTIHAPNNDDWYKWRAPAVGTMTATVVFSNSAGDLNLELYDSTQNLVTSSTSTTDNEQLSLPVVAGQTFFFRVFGVAGTIQPNYTLQIESNDAPTISDIADTATNEDTTTRAISFTVGDDETVATALTVSANSSNRSLVPNQNIVLGGNGTNRTITIKPAANQSGQVTVSVMVRDDEGATAIDTFVLTVNAVPDTPVVVSPSMGVSVNEDAADVTVSLTSIFSDPDIATSGDALTFSVTSNNNSSLVNATISGTVLRLDFQNNKFGSALVRVRATDTTGRFAETSIPVTVGPVNDAPVNTFPAASTIDEDTTLVFSAAGGNAITISDVDANGNDLLTVLTALRGSMRTGSNAGVDVTGQGTNVLTVTGPLSAINTALDGMTYTPAVNFNGADTITITTNDLGSSGAGGARTDTDVLAITIRGIDDPPAFTSPDTLSVPENTSVAGTVAATDPEGDRPVFSITGGADRTQFTLGSASGQLSFTTPPDFENPADANGDNVYQIEITADDGKGHTSKQMLTVNVTNVDDDPPQVSIMAVAPDPRAQRVDQITVQFSEAVTGVTRSDFTLTRSTDRTVSLLPGSATLTTQDNMTWTLGNLGPLTGAAGNYELTFKANGSGVADSAGNLVATDAVATWTNGAGDVNGDNRFDQFDIIGILQSGKYLTQQVATWSEGDWNRDGRFNQLDIVLAQQTQPEHYLQGPFAVRGGSSGPAAAGPAPDAVDEIMASDQS